MCHHFQFQSAEESFLAWLEWEIGGRVGNTQGSFYPLALLPAVRADASGKWEWSQLQWGLLPFWWKPQERQKKPAAFQRMTFNARSETVDSKPTYRLPFQTQRCLIPATRFYEGGPFFRLQKEPFFWMAGLWDRWFDPEKPGQITESCTILTTQANPLVAEYHPKKRMPVILASAQSVEEWLDPRRKYRSDLEHLFEPLAAERMQIEHPED